jgi:hapalindole H/12-epi-hapalindole U/12-epi-fischerindole U/hapalindole U synthase
MIIALVLTCGGGGANAVVLGVTNPGFEADFAEDGTFPGGTPSGWSPYDPNGILDGAVDALGVVNPTGTTFFSAGVPEGRNAALVYLAGQPGEGEAGLFQTLAATVQPNTRYTLSVAVGNIDSGTGPPPSNVFFNLAGFPGYRIELRAGDLLLASNDRLQIADGTFATATAEATIGADHVALGQPLTIRLVNLNLPGTPDEPGIEVDFDQVLLQAVPIPEPSSYALLALGLLLGAMRMRMRQG